MKRASFGTVRAKVWIILLLSFQAIWPLRGSTEDMEKSIFQELYESGELANEILLDRELFFVFFDSHPVFPGHVLIVPKRRIVRFKEMNHSEQREYFEILIETEKALNQFDLEAFYQARLDEEESNPNSSPLKNRTRFTQHVLRILRTTKRGEALDFNVGYNDGRNAGRTVDHLHIHMIPRVEGDAENQRFGVRLINPGYADYSEGRGGQGGTTCDRSLQD